MEIDHQRVDVVHGALSTPRTAFFGTKKPSIITMIRFGHIDYICNRYFKSTRRLFMLYVNLENMSIVITHMYMALEILLMIGKSFAC